MERVIAVELKADATGLVQGFEQADKSAMSLNQSLDQTQKEIKGVEQTTQSISLEEKLANINAQVKSGELDIRQLGKMLKQYQSIALAAGENSPVGKQALQDAALLKDQIDGLNLKVKNLSHDAVNMKAAMELGRGVIAGYSAFQGVTAMLGVENEELQKTFVKLQGAQAAMMATEQLFNLTRKESFIAMKAQAIGTNLMTAAQTAYSTVVGTSTGALKVFKIALASTGIGALIVGLGLLIANFEAVSTWVKDTIKKFMNLSDTILVLLGPIGWLILAYKKLFGEAEEGYQKQIEMEKELAAEHKKRMARIEEEKKVKLAALDETIKGYQLEKDTLEAQGKSSEAVTLQILEAEKSKLEAVLDANRQKIESYVKYYTDLAALRGQDEEDFKRSMKAQGIDLDNLQEKANKLLQENQDQVQYAENKITKFKREQGEKRAADAKAAQKKMQDDQKKADEKMLALQAELDKLTIENMKDGFDKELMLLMSNHDKQREELIKKYGEDTELMKQLTIKQQNEIGNLVDKYEAEAQKKREDAMKKQAELDNELEDLRINGMKEGADKEMALLQKKHADELQAIREKYGAGTELEAELIIQQQQQLEELRQQLQLEQAQKILDESQNVLSQLEEINGLIGELQNQRLEQNKQRADQEIANNNKQKEAILKNEKLTAKQRAQIEYNFAMQNYQVQKQAAEAEDKIKEKQFKREKAFKLANIAIDTASAIVKAIATYGPPPSPLGIAGIASAATIGALQAAVVARSKYQSVAADIQPPSFTAPSDTESSSGGTGGGGQGNVQNDTTTLTDSLTGDKNKPVVIISQVEINKTAKELAMIDEVSTI